MNKKRLMKRLIDEIIPIAIIVVILSAVIYIALNL